MAKKANKDTKYSVRSIRKGTTEYFTESEYKGFKRLPLKTQQNFVVKSYDSNQQNSISLKDDKK